VILVVVAATAVSVARPQLLGEHLDHRPGAAVLGGPGALLEPAHDHHTDESRYAK
jgi:hypothetical protein